MHAPVKVRKILRIHTVDPRTVSRIEKPGPWGSTRSYRQCVMIKRDGTRCKGMALKGMDKCRMHGGALAKAAFRHGLFSKYIPTTLSSIYEEFANDPNIKSLRSEIAIARTLATTFLRKLEDSNKLDPALVTPVLECIRRLVATCSKIEDGEKYHIDIQVFHIVLNQISKIICDEVKDEKIRSKVADRLAQLSIPSLS